MSRSSLPILLNLPIPSNLAGPAAARAVGPDPAPRSPGRPLASAEAPLPSRAAAALHGAKVLAHRLRRLARDARQAPPRFNAAACPEGWRCLAESRSALRTASDPSERALEAGKIHNLRLAARTFDGVLLPPGGILSFWAQLGRPSVRRGFTVGREIRQGCLIPSVGGGLCQLSNALYDAALTAGLPVPERHAHSQVVPGSLAEVDRDATVFWNYVDLRIAAPEGLWIRCRLERDALVVRLYGPAPRAALSPNARLARPRPNSCATCGQTGCFRNAGATARRLERPRTAWLLDGVSPELDALQAAQRAAGDPVLLPVDGAAVGAARYAWRLGEAPRITAPHQAAVRALRARRLAGEGAARQAGLLADDAALAECLGARIPPDCAAAVVPLSLLPALWRGGWLGGRRFTVLGDRPSLHAIQAALDAAAARWPEALSLRDFRADPALLAAEAEALAACERICTAHPGDPGLPPAKVERLAWAPAAPGPRAPRGPLPVIVFPATTLARHGALALRAALPARPHQLLRCGPELEAPGFWGGRAREAPWPHALAAADVVVWTGHVPGAPRRLLEALARQIPVITTPAAGLSGTPGVSEVPAGDVAALAAALEAALEAAIAARRPGVAEGT